MEHNPLRVIDYPWHQAHLYRLHALPARFWLATIRSPLWNEAQRPKPENFAGGIAPEDIQPEAFDLALLHLDQWCDRDPVRAYPFRAMRTKTEGIPQIVIMHGTPDDPENRVRMLRLIGDLPVVCNSREAAREWDGGEGRLDRYGLPQFRPIIHGYRVDEFWSLPLQERRVEAITICSGGKMSQEYHGLPLVRRLMRDFQGELFWLGPQGNRPWCPSYAEYRQMLASSLIYLSPTRRGPMPGSRTEAMLAGACIVSVPGQDWEGYIENGRTGFIVDSYHEVRGFLRYLLENPGVAYSVGQAGREMARSAFDHKRYVNDWLAALAQIGVRV